LNASGAAVSYNASSVDQLLYPFEINLRRMSESGCVLFLARPTRTSPSPQSESTAAAYEGTSD